MEAHKREAIQKHAAGESERRWQIVKRWPGLSGEAKIAWQYLDRKSNGGREQIAIKPVELGNDQNTSDDAGTRYLAALGPAREKREKGKTREIGQGLIEMTDLGRGVKLVTVLDPLDVAKARRACGGDSQTLFAFVDEVERERGTEYPPAVVGFVPAADPPADPRRPTDIQAEPAADPRQPEPLLTAEPPADPRQLRGTTRGSAATATTSIGKGVSHGVTLTKDKDKVFDLYKTKTKTNLTLSNLSLDGARRGSAEVAATASAATLGAFPVSTVLGDVSTALLDGTAYETALERTKARIRDAVRDAAAEPVVIALALAHADNRVKRADLDPLLARIASGLDRDGRTIVNRGGFFRRQVLFKFRDLGIDPADYALKPFKPRPK